MQQKMTIREAYLQASSFFNNECSIVDATYCAELLLRHLLGWTRAEFFMRWHEPLAADLHTRWREMVARRGAGEPAQYIIGEQAFFGLNFYVDRRVLIPRPETELLVEQVLERVAALDIEAAGGGGAAVVDVGTGSGAIPISLAVQRPRWRFTAVDLSVDALEVARHNAELHGVAERIRFVHGDGLRRLPQDGGSWVTEPIDVLISNPPYITTAEMIDLQREVHDHEPHMALCGGADGLQVYRQIVEQLKQLPQLPKLIAFETGQGQTEAVAALLRPLYRSEKMDIVHDLAGTDRRGFAVD